MTSPSDHEPLVHVTLEFDVAAEVIRLSARHEYTRHGPDFLPLTDPATGDRLFDVSVGDTVDGLRCPVMPVMHPPGLGVMFLPPRWSLWVGVRGANPTVTVTARALRLLLFVRGALIGGIVHPDYEAPPVDARPRPPEPAEPRPDDFDPEVTFS